MKQIATWPRLFWNFWWDFLVGETPELFIATLIMVAVALGLRTHASLTVVLLPALAIGFLVASTWRGLAAARGAESDSPTESDETSS